MVLSAMAEDQFDDRPSRRVVEMKVWATLWEEVKEKTIGLTAKRLNGPLFIQPCRKQRQTDPERIGVALWWHTEQFEKTMAPGYTSLCPDA